MCHRHFQQSFLGLYNDGKDMRNNARQAAMADRPAPKEQQGHTQSYSANPYWYVDTAATDHLTSDLGKLHFHEAYHESSALQYSLSSICDA
jgi:hypothetical protein